jgi:S1-C subfamily serine protease
METNKFQQAIVSNFFQRVHFMKFRQSTGTCFTYYDDENNEYFITAKHVIEGIGNSGTIQIMQDNVWKNLNVTVKYHTNNEIDIVLLIPETRIIIHPSNVKCSMHGISLGQDTFFLGFPYGIYSNTGSDIQPHSPLPFIKKGVTASIVNEKGKIILYLDGHNNPGFSGGPVCFQNIFTGEYQIAAVVSAYRLNNPQNIMNEKGEKSDLLYMENSGIVISYSIDHVLDIIKNF